MHGPVFFHRGNINSRHYRRVVASGTHFGEGQGASEALFEEHPFGDPIVGQRSISLGGQSNHLSMIFIANTMS